MNARDFFAGRSFTSADRQPIPVVTDAGTLNPPIPPRRDDDAITLTFDRARDAIRRLETERLVHIGGEWSPSHHVQK